MPSPTGTASRRSPAEVQSVIERFLKTSQQPHLFEAGEPPLPLLPGSYDLTLSNGRLTMQAWTESTTLSRRVVNVLTEGPGKLELQVEHFGKRLGTVTLLDLARPKHQMAVKRSGKLAFRERFRHWLLRHYGDWQLAELSTEMDLEHSLSPNYSRALLRKGKSAWAAIGSDQDHADGILTFGLIWLDYLRRRESRHYVRGLLLLLPESCWQATLHRLAWLDSTKAEYHLFGFDPEGYERLIDLQDRGNLETHLPERAVVEPSATLPLEAWQERLTALPDVEAVELRQGVISLRVRGWEFARREQNRLLFGLETKTVAAASNLPEIEALVYQLGQFRHARADRSSRLYQRQPELWLESQVRRGIERLDSSLLPAPLYGQVPSFAGHDRGVADLLAVERSGRLAVIELKASAEIHLPLQALDYWMRVRWHLAQGDFSSRGYFPNVELSSAPPRLALVAPALEFHPTTEAILQFFARDVEVERIGLAADWRHELRVMFRRRGAERPQVEERGEAPWPYA